MKVKYEYVIGIDPDVDGSGVGVLFAGKEVRKEQLQLPQLVEYLKDTKAKGTMMTYIEAGWMNKGNYHLENKGQYHASKIGVDIGRNHEIGRQIGAFCEYYEIPFEYVRPLKKVWNGKGGKITHEELQDLMEGSVAVPCSGRTNQEIRDAILLALVHSGIPLSTRKIFR